VIMNHLVCESQRFQLLSNMDLEGSLCDESNEDLGSNSNEDRGLKYECVHQEKSSPSIVI
jgi:hypothetical protein